MSVRFALPLTALALAFAVGGCSSNAPNGSAAPPVQVRPAQMTEMSQCDQLAQQVENGMPTAKAYRVPYAQRDLQKAQELCHSGQPEQGISILQGALGYMDQEP